MRLQFDMWFLVGLRVGRYSRASGCGVPIIDKCEGSILFLERKSPSYPWPSTPSLVPEEGIAPVVNCTATSETIPTSEDVDERAESRGNGSLPVLEPDLFHAEPPPSAHSTHLQVLRGNRVAIWDAPGNVLDGLHSHQHRFLTASLVNSIVTCLLFLFTLAYNAVACQAPQTAPSTAGLLN